MSDIKNWADDAALNIETSPNGWPEGMPPSDVNNSAREMMAAIRRSYVRQPWFAPGGAIVRASADTITIADDSKVTNYANYYTVGARVRIETTDDYVTGFVVKALYEAPTSTITFKLDADANLPAVITDVYVGLSPEDIQGVAGPDLVGCVLGFSSSTDKLGVGLLLANGEKFDPSIYTDLAQKYYVSPNVYKYGQELVGDTYWPLMPVIKPNEMMQATLSPVPPSWTADEITSPLTSPFTPTKDGTVVFYIPGRPVGTITVGNKSWTFDSNYNYTEPSLFSVPVKAGTQVSWVWYVWDGEVTFVESGAKTDPGNFSDLYGVVVAYGGIAAKGLARVDDLVDMAEDAESKANDAIAAVTALNPDTVDHYLGVVQSLPVQASYGDICTLASTGASYIRNAANNWVALGSSAYVAGTGISIAGNTISTSSEVLRNGTTSENSLSLLGANSAPYANTILIGDHARGGGTGIRIGMYAQNGSGGGVNIGKYSEGNSFGAVIGDESSGWGYHTVAIGYRAKVGTSETNADGGIMIGPGRNIDAHTLRVGFGQQVGETYTTYQLMNSSGNIPEERLAEIMIKGSEDPTSSTQGTVGLLYKNTVDGKLFICISASPSSVWEEVGTGTGGGGTAEVYTNPALTASGGVCTWTINHTIGSRDILVEVYNTTTYEQAVCTIARTSDNVVTVKFVSSADIGAGAYKAVLAASSSYGTGVFTINQAADTHISTPANGDALVYNGDTGLWTNSNDVALKSAANTFTGDATFANNLTVKYAHLEKQDSNLTGGVLYFNSADNEPNYGKMQYILRANGQLRFSGYNSSNVGVNPLTVDIQNNDVLANHLSLTSSVSGAQLIKSSVIDRTVTPPSNQYLNTEYLDKNGLRLGVVGGSKYTDGTYGIFMQAGNEGTFAIRSDGIDASVSASNNVKSSIVNWGMPDYSSGVTAYTNFQAPSNGYLRVQAYINGGIAYGYIDGVEVYRWWDDGNSHGSSFIPIKKGSVWTNGGGFEIQQFFPCIGG